MTFIATLALGLYAAIETYRAYESHQIGLPWVEQAIGAALAILLALMIIGG